MNISPNFAVIYRFYLEDSKEEEYISNWKVVADYFTQQRGAIGSSLHKTNQGYWLAYSRWPNKQTRDASWSKDNIKEDLPEKIKNAIANMKNCTDLTMEEFPEICMNVIEQTASN